MRFKNATFCTTLGFVAYVVTVTYVVGWSKSEIYLQVFILFLVNALAMFGSYQLESHHRSGFVKTLLLEEERRKSQALLLNILPETVAERLKSGEEPIADSFDETTILFADIERFTELSERMSPEDTVVLLNQLFCQFDELAKKYDLEKIKTVGDAYVVAAGMQHRHGWISSILAGPPIGCRQAQNMAP